MSIGELKLYSQIYNKKDMYFTDKFMDKKGRKDILNYCSEIINITNECIDNLENGNSEKLVDYFYRQCSKIHDKSHEIGDLLEDDLKTWSIFEENRGG